MKTIEDRAVDFGEKHYLTNVESERTSAEDGYITGATEQRKIDIDKACDVYRNELQEVLDLFTKYGEMRGIEQLGDIISIGGSVSDFRKAVEGGEK